MKTTELREEGENDDKGLSSKRGRGRGGEQEEEKGITKTKLTQSKGCSAVCNPLHALRRGIHIMIYNMTSLRSRTMPGAFRNHISLISQQFWATIGHVERCQVPGQNESHRLYLDHQMNE